MFQYDPDKDPNRSDPDPHFRVVKGREGKPCIIEVQGFDYYDYDDGIFLSYEGYRTRAAAEDGLLLLRAKAAQILGLL